MTNEMNAARPVGDEVFPWEREWWPGNSLPKDGSWFRGLDLVTWHEADARWSDGHDACFRGRNGEVLTPSIWQPLASHPTTGQETVATPREDGVRQAPGRVNARAEADSYEFRADESDYTPTEHERAMLEDFGNGLIARVEEEFAALSAPGSAGPGEDPVRHAFRNADSLDWWHLINFIPDSGQGKFWKSVLHEVQEGLATPSPAQEPGTGDRGEPNEDTPRCYMCSDIVGTEPSHTHPLEGEVHERCCSGEEVAAPATTAETRGPAEGAR